MNKLSRVFIFFYDTRTTQQHYTTKMTLQFQHGSTLSRRHAESQSLSTRSVSTSLLTCATATVTGTLTIDGAPVVGRTPVTAESETVQVLDTTGATANSVTTLQAALDALVLAAGSSDVAVVSIVAGQTLALSTDVTFSEVQRHYSRVVVRGAGRTVSLTDTVASVASGGPFNSWYEPTMTTALTASAHAQHILLNTNNGHYFAIVDNDTTTLSVCAPLTIRGGSTNVITYTDDEINSSSQPFNVSGDSVIAFLPTSEILLTLQVRFHQMPGATVEFEEIKLTMSSSEDEDENVFACALISNGLLYFRGCIINTNDMDPNTEFYSVGIRSATTLDGCVIEEIGGGAAGLFSVVNPGEEKYQVFLMKCYYVAGSFNNVYSEVPPFDVMLLGCTIEADIISSNRTPLFIVDSCDVAVSVNFSLENLRVYSSTFAGDAIFNASKISLDSVTVIGDLTVQLCGNCNLIAVNSSQLYIYECGRVYVANCAIAASPTQPYGCVIRRSFVTGTLPTVTGTTTAAVSIQNNSNVAVLSSNSVGTNTGLGVEVLSGSSLVSSGGAPYGAAFTSVASNNIKVGDNAAVTFATIATGLAADVSDYTTASPQMARATIV